MLVSKVFHNNDVLVSSAVLVAIQNLFYFSLFLFIYNCQDHEWETLFIFIFSLLFDFSFSFIFYFLFLEQLRLGVISHAVTSVTRLITGLGRIK